MTESIHTFLNERKELWLKDRVKKAENDVERAELQQQADDRFSLKEWLPDAASVETLFFEKNFTQHTQKEKQAHKQACFSNVKTLFIFSKRIFFPS